MQPHGVRSLRFAALTLAAGLAACSGGGSTAPTASGSTDHSAAAQFSLGLIEAAPADLARMAQIRRVLGTTPLPPVIDLSPKMPPVGDQGNEGSCVSWASAYALRGYEARQDVWSSTAPKTTDAAHNFSPAFVYNQINGGRDAGSSIPAALGFLQQKGAATLADMPYVAGKYTTQPSAGAVANALHYKLSSYGYIAPTDLLSMKAQLAGGIPVILAIQVYHNFFSLGQNQVYSSVSGAYQGGHAITIVGYDDTKGAVEIINSWGPSWGTAGYGWISYVALKQIALEAYSAIDDHGPPLTPTPQVSPTPNAKPSATTTPTPKPSATPTPSPKPSATPTPSPKPSATLTPSTKPSATPTPSPKPSTTPAPAATQTPKPSPTATPKK